MEPIRCHQHALMAKGKGEHVGTIPYAITWIPVAVPAPIPVAGQPAGMPTIVVAPVCYDCIPVFSMTVEDEVLEGEIVS